jgi:Domain of unknown function (DUF3870)
MGEVWGDRAAMDDAVVIAGYGKLPQGTSVEQLHKVLALVVLVDRPTGVVLDASSTLMTPVGDRFVCHHLRGLNLVRDSPRFISAITDGYQGHAQKAIIAAFRDLVRRYLETCGGSGGESALDMPTTTAQE